MHLIQEYGVSQLVAKRLRKAYGGRARDVLDIAVESQKERLRAKALRNGDAQHDYYVKYGSFFTDNSEFYKELLLIPGHPYIEAEVTFAVRHDWAVKASDFIARRTRLAFVDKDSALQVVPRVVQLMAEELNWSPDRQAEEIESCVDYLRYFGGPHVSKHDMDGIRLATDEDMKDVFRKVDQNQSGTIKRSEVLLVAEMLHHEMTTDELNDCMLSASTSDMARGEIAFDEFTKWWNSERFNEGLKVMREVKSAVEGEEKGRGVLFG